MLPFPSTFLPLLFLPRSSHIYTPIEIPIPRVLIQRRAETRLCHAGGRTNNVCAVRRELLCESRSPLTAVSWLPLTSPRRKQITIVLRL
ncbi:hypothetical protein F4802DRAFT_531813 [Xylaria palmicola]|nr:hypothetical protein F4802DRAFT_531813 [Xylaria palmicola]